MTEGPGCTVSMVTVYYWLLQLGDFLLILFLKFWSNRTTFEHVWFYQNPAGAVHQSLPDFNSSSVVLFLL